MKNKERKQKIYDAYQEYGKALDGKIERMDESASIESEKVVREKLGKRLKKRKPFIWTKNKKLVAILSCALAFVMIMTPVINNLTKKVPSSMVAYAATQPKSFSYFDYEGKRENYLANKTDEGLVGKRINGFAYASSYEVLKDKTENTNYSPIVVYNALSLLANGAKGETKRELLTALNMNFKSDEYIADQLGKLYRYSYSNNSFSKYVLSNSVWLNDKAKFYEDFVGKMDNFYTDLYRVDFSKDSTEKYMNNWVEERTGLKPDFQYDESTLMSILSTIDFYGMWKDEFKKGENTNSDFTLQNGETVQTEYMNSEYSSNGFAYSDTFLRSSLSFKEGSMTFVLPREGYDVYDILQSSESLAEAFEGGESTNGKVVWSLPKFEFSTSLDLKDSLKAMGVNEIFEADADFSNMIDQTAFVSGINQQTKIKVDEKGVSASAYVEIFLAGAAAPTPEECYMILNKPFLYSINCGGVAFIGVVFNPNAR